jgi:uncharacterized protein (UPF0332 family)
MEQLPEKYCGKLLDQFLELFVLPELKKRKEKDELEDSFSLRGAQIIFYPDGRKPQIRINSEVKVLAYAKLKSGISKNKGDPIYSTEIEDLNRFRLTDEDDPDCGHATIVKIGDRWIIAFDFRYNKALAKKHIETAKQFYESAAFSFKQKDYASCLDNLFSAAELASKAVLLLIPDPKFRKKTTHGGIQLRYNKFADLGNVEPNFREALNRLSSLRPRARYHGDVAISEKDIQSLLETAKEMITDATDRVEGKEKPLIYKLKLKADADRSTP